MPSFKNRLFLRIIIKNREVYLLKIITLAIAFACTSLVALFALHEFGYDRFHENHGSIFRAIQRNSSDTYNGNRLSTQIPPAAFTALKTKSPADIVVARVKILDGLAVITQTKIIHHIKFHAADTTLRHVFSFQLLDGAWKDFNEHKRAVALSASRAGELFGTDQAAGRQLKIFAYGDTLRYFVAAVYKDFPSNSHEEFNGLLHFDPDAIRVLNFNPHFSGVYGKANSSSQSTYPPDLSRLVASNDLTYYLQPIAEIYFGPRVRGEDAHHGDKYSIIILVAITFMTFLLALSNLVNLTTLTLPCRSKELAIKKLAGSSQPGLTLGLARESFAMVGLSMVMGLLLLLVSSPWIQSLLSIDLILLFRQGDFLLLLILAVLFLTVGAAPLFMTLRFTGATPARLLSTDTISFPRFKRVITFLQLGISLFLITASMVMRRQITYSLLKEPGRNHEQVVYVSYPSDLTVEGLNRLRLGWKKNHPNIEDVMASSQLPNHISSKELNSPFYFMSVDRGFQAFFDLKIVKGFWFNANAGDSIAVVNTAADKLIGSADRGNVAGTFTDLGERFNLPEKPVKLNVATHFNFNFLLIRVLEVDIRRTLDFLGRYFEQGSKKATVSFLDKRFEEWLHYQDKLNTLSGVLAIISGILSCCAVYGLSVSMVRDKIKPIALHKLFGASTAGITRLLVREFTMQVVAAIVVFGPLTYVVLKELLRTFVYATGFSWMDPLVPLTYCVTVITLLCGFQALSLNGKDLSAALKA